MELGWHIDDNNNTTSLILNYDHNKIIRSNIENSLSVFILHYRLYIFNAHVSYEISMRHGLYLLLVFRNAAT